jgi:hypothetical protein
MTNVMQYHLFLHVLSIIQNRMQAINSVVLLYVQSVIPSVCNEICSSYYVEAYMLHRIKFIWKSFGCWSTERASKFYNVKLSLCLTNWALRHEDICGSGCIDPNFLDLGISWSWVVSFTPLPLYPRERVPSTHFIGSWVDPRAGLDHWRSEIQIL